MQFECKFVEGWQFFRVSLNIDIMWISSCLYTVWCHEIYGCLPLTRTSNSKKELSSLQAELLWKGWLILWAFDQIMNIKKSRFLITYVEKVSIKVARIVGIGFMTLEKYTIVLTKLSKQAEKQTCVETLCAFRTLSFGMFILTSKDWIYKE